MGGGGWQRGEDGRERGKQEDALDVWIFKNYVEFEAQKT